MKLQRLVLLMVVVAFSVALVGCATSQKTVLSDQEIANNIKAHLESPAGPEGPFVIDVIVDRGVVKLDGKVKNAAAKAEAMDIAQQAQGVEEVKSFLVVQ